MTVVNGWKLSFHQSLVLNLTFLCVVFFCFFFSLQLWEVYGDRRCLRTFIGNISFLSGYKSVWNYSNIINSNFTTTNFATDVKESLHRLE